MSALVLKRLGALPVLGLGVIAALLIASAAAVATLSVTSTTTAITLESEALSTDSNTSVVNETIVKSAATATSNSTSSSPVEATTGLAEVRGALTADNWEYKFEVKESGVNTWPGTTNRTIEVYGDGSLIATLYVTNATADISNVEGVTAKVDLGTSSIANNISVKVK